MSNNRPDWQAVFHQMPLIAILRGITADECVPIAETLIESGFNLLEIPLNSPDPYTSIGTLTEAYPDKLIGAGTVVSTEQLANCEAVGCTVIVAPRSAPPEAA